jgi:NDP-sugar pyrophosphorylase family protein
MRYWGRVNKAVILAAGTGGRMTPVTKGKISKVNVEINGGPLLAHTLKTLKERKVTNVALVIRPDQQKEFDALIANGKFPKINYTFIYSELKGTGRTTASMLNKIFNLPKIRSFIGNDPAMVLFGDTFVFPRFIKEALTNFIYRKRPLFLALPKRTTSSQQEQFYEKVVESQEFNPHELPTSFFGFITTPNFFEFLQKNLIAHRGMGKIIPFAHKQGFPCGVMHGQAINANSTIDYIAIREVLAGRLRFPYPEHWVRQHLPELQKITRYKDRRKTKDYRKRTRGGNHK